MLELARQTFGIQIGRTLFRLIQLNTRITDLFMNAQKRARSFEPNANNTISLPTGQIAHRDHAEHSALLVRNFYQVCPGVWCLVGNGLSNQTFIEAPNGIIAIDTGEVNGSFQMRALAHVQEWRTLHRDELTDTWTLARASKPLPRIEPLE